MRIRLLSLELLCLFLTTAALAGFSQREVAAQITFVQAPQNRNQTQNQDQRGLPPEQKRSLSRYGPEDVFPGANEQESSRRRNSRSRQRSQTVSASRPIPTPGLSPVAAPIATPSETPTQPATAKPSPTMLTAMGNKLQQAAPDQQSLSSESASPWVVPVLSGLALIVSIALIYVLTKLIEKIREDSPV